jgi:hypothetical protein
MGILALRHLTNQKEDVKKDRKENRFAQLTGLQGKLIIPYMLLTIVLAMGGVYIVTRLVTSSIRERFVNQLFEASRVAAEGIVRQEDQHLENLRTMVFTTGVQEAVEENNAESLYKLLSPHVLNQNIQTLTVVDANGFEVLSIEQLPDGNYQQSTGTDLNSIEIVSKTLAGQTDTFGDKFIDILPGNNGPALFTSAPIKNKFGQLSGVMLVGTPMDALLKDIRSQALSDIVLLGAEEGVISTTLVSSQEGFPEIETLAKSLDIAGIGHTYDIIRARLSDHLQSAHHSRPDDWPAGCCAAQQLCRLHRSDQPQYPGPALHPGYTGSDHHRLLHFTKYCQTHPAPAIPVPICCLR